MKSFLKPIALCALSLSITVAAAADSFLIGSYCTTAGCPDQPGLMNSPTVFGSYSTTELTSVEAATVPTGATQTFFADPGSVWAQPGSIFRAPSNWVSWQPGTGPGNFTNTSPAGFYNYYTTFTPILLGDDPDRIVGNIFVAADDTTSVWLNGILLQPAAALGNDPICAVDLPNCRNHLGPFVYVYQLHDGPNVVAFSVQQNTLYTGLDYYASLAITPEPATLFLLSTGLAASATMVLWRTRKSNPDASGR